MYWLLIAGAVWLVTALPLAVAVGRAFAAAETQAREVAVADRLSRARRFPTAQAG